MYDPGIGRWLEEDPEGFNAGDANLYRYVDNAPGNYVDPSGLQLRSPPNILDQLRRYDLYRERAGSNLSFEEWVAQDENRPIIPPVLPGGNPLGLTPEQQRRENIERQMAQGQNIPETPGIRSLSRLEQEALDQQLRRLHLDMMYYQFWFYDLPGALSSVIPTGGGGRRSPAMPRRIPRRVQIAAQSRFNADLARTGRIILEMEALGFSSQEIGVWRTAALSRVDGRFQRVLDQLPDTLPPLPPPPGIRE